MTEATQMRPSLSPRTDLEIHYQVAMSQPETHLFEVTLHLKGWRSDRLDLKMPVWTPGSYLVREYARHLQDFQAMGGGGQSLAWRKQSKNHWQVETVGVSEITVQYRIYANELTVRTNHLDITHGYFNGAALFFYIPEFQHCPIQVTIVPPRVDWPIATTLPAIPHQKHTFLAADYDTLVDSPFEVGYHRTYEFEALGKTHQFVLWGSGNIDPEQTVVDIKKIIETEAALFGGLPYDRYMFLLHIAAQGFGGLEHKNSCSLIYSRFGFQTDDRYHRFMQLVAHEFFHLWNVKRIRPKGLEVFDYEGENYTPSLWFSEGATSYYDITFPLRAGIYDARVFLKSLSKEISRYLTTPGRQVQPLSESSFDAWIKLYRRDSNSDNSQISYYLKGEMVSLLLDLRIRAKFNNQRSLDDVLRQLWQQFGQPEIGFTPEELQTVIESVAEEDLSDFFHRYLDTTEELPFDRYLEPFGLQVQPDTEDLEPFLGMTVRSENGREVVKFVEANSPARRAGLDPDDELLAIDSLRVKASDLSDRLKCYAAGETIHVSVFHQDELRTYRVTLTEPRPTSYQLVPVKDPSPAQKQALEGWLGTTWETIQS
ncbi:M61 family metallopeptidase [Egbenema bharatensis]|uniref:M61 family metallopeptidase n=1 Tax=Egbenema bharatensis TaxID=3463334 RepID=UPI003A87CA76